LLLCNKTIIRIEEGIFCALAALGVSINTTVGYVSYHFALLGRKLLINHSAEDLMHNVRVLDLNSFLRTLRVITQQRSGNVADQLSNPLFSRNTVSRFAFKFH